MMRLAQRLIRPGESPSDQPVRKRLGTFASAVGVGTNILLSLTKVIIGTLTGSLAVTADASTTCPTRQAALCRSSASALPKAH